MDRGVCQSHFDSEVYENIPYKKEPTESKRKKKEIHKEPEGGKVSSKVENTSELSRPQRRLLMVLVTLLVLVFIFLIILTCLMFIYYEEKANLLIQIKTINQTLDEEKVNLLSQITTINKILDEDKAKLLTQITAINQTLDGDKSNLLAQITTMKETLDKQKNNLLTQITTIKHTLDEQKANLLTQVSTIKQTLDSRISEAINRMKQDILQTIQKERPQCDSGWKPFDGSCYYIVTTQKNWIDAQSNCKSMNSDLVIINSDREKNFLESLTDNSFFWIGLKRDNKDKDEWRWVDGTYYYPPQRFWYKGEPNNEDGREDCVHMWKEKKWNDVFCTGLYKAICEKN
eukprot:XP_012808528.2 PREDICTED: CD209 antigen-like protein D [Xenopus tropicalis]